MGVRMLYFIGKKPKLYFIFFMFKCKSYLRSTPVNFTWSYSVPTWSFLFRLDLYYRWEHKVINVSGSTKILQPPVTRWRARILKAKPKSWGWDSLIKGSLENGRAPKFKAQMNFEMYKGISWPEMPCHLLTEKDFSESCFPISCYTHQNRKLFLYS